jgi:hypothetical protein
MLATLGVMLAVMLATLGVFDDVVSDDVIGDNVMMLASLGVVGDDVIGDDVICDDVMLATLHVCVQLLRPLYAFVGGVRAGLAQLRVSPCELCIVLEQRMDLALEPVLLLQVRLLPL